MEYTPSSASVVKEPERRRHVQSICIILAPLVTVAMEIKGACVRVKLEPRGSCARKTHTVKMRPLGFIGYCCQGDQAYARQGLSLCSTAQASWLTSSRGAGRNRLTKCTQEHRGNEAIKYLKFRRAFAEMPLCRVVRA
ncbi:hypothetical protein NDU88_002458 [Pleurodeles waltl]|uniref:Uncharacterized protein n=1 Tax=Pleurodeles waltl TaxID=8319 RepID=A0AAV7VAL2_PLEWA|nr:hypothetical protein NDU88_002458 [Pleurodeles waltl]